LDVISCSLPLYSKEIYCCNTCTYLFFRTWSVHKFQPTCLALPPRQMRSLSWSKSLLAKYTRWPHLQRSATCQCQMKVMTCWWFTYPPQRMDRLRRPSRTVVS